MKKSEVIRGVLKADPTGKPKALAVVASKKFGALIKPTDISNYKTAMKKSGELNGKPTPESVTVHAPATSAPKSVVFGRQTMTVVETVEVVRDLVEQLGKDELKKLVDLI